MDKETNTNPFSQIGIINKETKRSKKPHNITINNYNPNEPKINVNMKYSEKQKYRRYKTKTEPKLHNKIMIDEEDDIVNTIKKAFGIEDKKKTNYSSPETSGAPHYEEPNPIEPEEPIVVPKYKTTEDPKPDVAQEREIIPRARTISIATEITSEIASPSPISPGKLIALQALEKGKKRDKMRKQAEAEAEERSKKERERLHSLSETAKTAQEKAKETPKGLTPEQEMRLQNHIKTNFIGITSKEEIELRNQMIISGYLPNVDLWGKTPKDREKRQKERDEAHRSLYFPKSGK